LFFAQNLTVLLLKKPNQEEDINLKKPFIRTIFSFWSMLNCKCMNSFSINATSRSYPVLPYEQIKNDILGKSYELSLVFVSAAKAKALNQAYRQKSYIPNVLSFPLSDSLGEIIITPTTAKKEAPKFNLTPNSYIGFLFIHGCLHLKGLDHSDTMDKAEKKYCIKYHLA